jgi:hypothetical protein
MTLAAILLFFLLSVGGRSVGPATGLQAFAAPNQAQDQNGAAPAQSQTPPAQSTNPEPTPAPPAGQAPNSSNPAKPPVKRPAHHKKISNPDCSNSPAPLNSPGGGNPNSATGTGATVADSADTHAAPADPVPAGPANGGSAAVKPCPPSKVVIKNGGSNEPVVALKGNTSEEQAAQQRFTTEQLTAATEENLKKIAGRALKPGEQEVVTQIKQFMAQAKSAVAAGDLARGRNLAVKARLLSDELVKP